MKPLIFILNTDGQMELLTKEAIHKMSGDLKWHHLSPCNSFPSDIEFAETVTLEGEWVKHPDGTLELKEVSIVPRRTK